MKLPRASGPALTLWLVAWTSAASAATVTGTAAPGAVVWVSSAAPAALAPGPARTVEIRNIHRSFDPDIVIVPVGSTVRFSNDDPFFHSIFSTTDPGAFDLGFYSSGPGKTVSFAHAGVVSVRCHIHHAMHAVIVVVDGPAVRSDVRSGAFSLSGLASGAYTLHAWDNRAGVERDAAFSIAPNTETTTLRLR
jgi:plastocyanin